MRKYFFLLAVLGLVMATAPSWVQEGTSIRYALYQYHSSMGPSSSTAVEVSVVSVTGKEATLDLKIGAGESHPKDNLSKTFSDTQLFYWFDPSRLSGTLNAGQGISGWTVKEVHTFRIAGKDWNAITLEKPVDGVAIKTTYDRESGLLLSYNATPGSEVINALFISMDPPLGGTVTPPAPAPAEEPETVEPPAGTTPAEVAEEPETIEPPGPIELPPIEEPAEPERQNIPCVPFIFVLGMLATGIWVGRN